MLPNELYCLFPKSKLAVLEKKPPLLVGDQPEGSGAARLPYTPDITLRPELFWATSPLIQVSVYHRQGPAHLDLRLLKGAEMASSGSSMGGLLSREGAS